MVDLKGWKVPGYKVLLKLKAVDDFLDEQLEQQEHLKRMGFKIEIQDKKMQRLSMDIGTVVDIGEMAWKTEALGYGKDGWKPWAKVGDEVIITKYCGREMQVPGLEDQMFYIVADTDIHMVNPEINEKDKE